MRYGPRMTADPTQAVLRTERLVLRPMAATDVEFVLAEGFAYGPEAAEKAAQESRVSVAQKVPAKIDTAPQAEVATASAGGSFLGNLMKKLFG